jgi:biotin transport system substrate-specific component
MLLAPKQKKGGRIIETMNTSQNLRMTVYASLFAALISVGAYLSIPIGPVPIVLQNLFVLLSGLLLGNRWGFATVSVYLLAGAVGLPVFAGGLGGIGRILGPTGGYLIGYLPAVWIVGIISKKWGPRAVFDVIAMVLGSIIIYACGVAWLKNITGMTMMKTLAIGVFPFLLGDALKIAAAVPIARVLRTVIQIPDNGNQAPNT